MKAFISYSINDIDQIIVTLLSNNLRNKGFQIMASYNFYSNELDFSTKKMIENSQVFFGIITKSGKEKERVISEWNYAENIQLPNILLVEDKIYNFNNYKENIVIFNRNNPEIAINKINRKMQNNSSNSNDKNIWPWIIGGAALLGILKLLSNENK